MIKDISRMLMEFFLGSLNLPFEAALLLTIMTFFLVFAIFVCAGARIMRTRLCRPLRRLIGKAYKEDDVYYSPDTEG
jgi:hypothetical protein